MYHSLGLSTSTHTRLYYTTSRPSTHTKPVIIHRSGSINRHKAGRNALQRLSNPADQRHTQPVIHYPHSLLQSTSVSHPTLHIGAVDVNTIRILNTTLIENAYARVHRKFFGHIYLLDQLRTDGRGRVPCLQNIRLLIGFLCWALSDAIQRFCSCEVMRDYYFLSQFHSISIMNVIIAILNIPAAITISVIIERIVVGKKWKYIR